MVRISSRSTSFNKRVFPAIWFGGVGVGALIAIAHKSSFGILTTSLMAAFGYALMKNVVFDLVDEVWDCGDALVVKNRGKEQRIPLNEFMNLEYSGVHDPARITLTLRNPTEFGTEVSFIPAPPPMRSFSVYWWPYTFSKPPISEDLMRRIDSARRNQ